jgi:hypothetical protein
MKKLFMLALALMMVFGMAVSAQAHVILDFEIPANSGFLGGSFTFDTATNTYSGSNITVAEVYGILTPLNTGSSLFIGDDAVLNFAFSATDNFITISSKSGGLNYLEGTFIPGTLEIFNNRTFQAEYIDTKPNTDVADYFGYSTAFQFSGFMTMDFIAFLDTGNTLDGSIHNAPIPGSLVLLGSGILGIFGIGLRRKSA